MSIVSQTILASAGLDNADIKEILVLLYKLLKPKKVTLDGSSYQYNYDYLPPLAMTGASTFFDFDIPLPAEEIPNPKWVLLVIHKITVILVNDAISSTANFLGKLISFDVNNAPDSETEQLINKVQDLEDIAEQINAAENDSDLEQIIFSLASITQDVNDLLSPTDSNVSFSVGEVSEIDARLREVDEAYANQYTNENEQGISFSLPSASGEPTDRLSDALKNIIRANVGLLELEKLPQPVSFAAPGSASQPTLEDYKKLFKKIPLPEISSRFEEDLVFAYLRVAGPNPVMLEQVSGNSPLQITNEQYRQITGTSDTLEAAIAEGRLYKADYSALKDMKGGNFPSEQKYIYAPLALFAVPPSGSSSRSLLPVAIQCQQPSVPNNPIFTPLSGDNWQVAKTILQMADGNYHELVSHLGRTHLFIEPFAIATRRQLPTNHPLRVLLDPHLEGTILINYGAHKLLVADKGRVDQILASTIDSDRQVAAQGALDYLHNFDAAAFPNILSSRGVESTAKLPNYPYRDDGLLIWNATQKWVRAYLSAYYTDAQKIANDQRLQSWSRELISESGGRLQNFGEDASGSIKTLDYLIHVVTTIIFTASAQHAAVNFPQSELMSYTPAYPLAVYSPAPTSIDQPGNFLNILPSLDQAKNQLKVCYLLGSVYYTQLGQYSIASFKSNQQIYSALLTYQKQLQDIEQEITHRNRTNSARLLPYKFLLPSQIPQSINI